ncbi:MAG TPA: hypothetical protein PLZ15_12905 [Melioribacteraceae bacterium]|nr:hypothetical protein [Melioribacteraceae bacterium]
MEDQEVKPNEIKAEEKPPEKKKRSVFRRIINVFILFFLAVIFLLVLFLGFSQTGTFREFLRNTLISEISSSINGKLYIEKIEGTILTSIFLRNTVLTTSGDTLFTAKKIEIKTSPLQLLLKKIFFRKILIEDAKIKLLQDQDGNWNYEKLSPPSEEDTAKSEFSFYVQVNDLQLKNIAVIQQSYPNINSNAVYKTVNFDDLRINKLFLSAQAFIDIPNSDFLLVLNELSFKPNLNRFRLQNISGEFAVTKDFASVTNFAFITDSSDVRIDARLDSLNLFGNVELEDFKNYPLSINLDASSFNFDDLSSFIDATEILKGDPSIELKARGKFGGFSIEKLAVDYRSTHFEIGGQVLNLNRPEDLFIKAQIKDTDINYRDVNALLPALKLPEFAQLKVSGVNIDYEGEPVNFKSVFSGNIENGSLKFEVAMNLEKEPMTYDIKFETENIDLNPVIGITTALNSKGNLIGRGTSPMDLNYNFNLISTASRFREIPIDNFHIISKAADRKIDIEMSGKSKNSEALITGDLSFDNDTIPAFSFLGSLNRLDLSSFIEGDYKSDLNFYFSAEGKNFNPDELTGIFSIGIDSSKYRGTKIHNSSIDVTFTKDSSYREIKFGSDFVDFKIDGEFSFKDAIDIVAFEGETISRIITNKLKELNPLSVMESGSSDLYTEEILPDIINKDLKFNFDFNFKDFALITELIGFERFDIMGSGSGSVDNSPPNFMINSKLDLDYLVFTEENSTLYLSDLVTELNFVRDNRHAAFDKLSGSALLTGKRFYAGSYIKDIAANLKFNESRLFFDASANFEDLIHAQASGFILMKPVEQQIRIGSIKADYDGLLWTNKDTIDIFFNPFRFNIANCTLYNDTSSISFKGSIESSGDQNLQLLANNISGKILSRYLFGQDDYKLKADADLKATISGSFDDPYINTSVKLNNLTYGNHKLGYLDGSIRYLNKTVSTDIRFIDSTYNTDKPLLTLNGTIPIDLSFATVEKRISDTKEMDLKIYSRDFDLRSFANLLPNIADQRGILLTDLSIKGRLDNPVFSGYLSLNDGYFLSKDTNLPYSCDLRLNFERQGLQIDSLVIANAGGTRFPGRIKGSGSIVFDGFKPKDMSIRFNGDLALFSDLSRSTSPLLYGDLKIGTGDDWILTLRNNRLFFRGDILLKETNLTLTTSDQSTVASSNYNVIYVVDSSKLDLEQVRFQEILESEAKGVDNNGDESIRLDYEIGVKVENSARVNIILSQAVNQKLLVEMRGDLNYESVAGEVRAQGAFDLMPGSKLEFFKTFDAEGKIRFETDITNPYLDIIATYKNDYIDPRNSSAAPQEVAVKIKIAGPLNDLGKNLAGNPESMGVYVGSRNIQNNVRESRYDYADAFSFILIGKFKDDLTAQDRAQVAGQTNAIGNTATSFLGSVLTSFVNSAVGDLVNNIQISQAGDYTKFSLSGRIQNLRYSFGGTTEVFQNIGKANLKIEYLFNPRFLIRLERKDPIGQTYVIDEKINEMALKYKFEF